MSTGPQIYQIQREMSSVQQGIDSITTYYSKLHRTWDEMDHLVPLPVCKCTNCTCNLTDKLKALTSSTRLLQFLMGLNSDFEVIRGQILNLDPLPTVSKAFSMVLRAESQKTVTQNYSSSIAEGSAMLVKAASSKSAGDNKYYSGQKKDDSKKSDRFCDHCQIIGHTKDTCFKLHGYPDWFKELRNSKKGFPPKKASANMVSTAGSHDKIDEKEGNGKHEIASMVTQLVKEEMGKLLKGKHVDEQVNYANFEDFAGTILSSHSSKLMDFGCWIIDTGASSHMSSHIDTLQHIESVLPPIKIHLPDSSTKLVTKKCHITLHPKLVLHNVLIIPSFKFNLLSVNRLIKDSGLNLTFLDSHCIIQDPKNKAVVAVAEVKRNLYILEQKSFDPIFIQSVLVLYNSALCFANNVLSCTSSQMINENSTSVWHQRLGHCSSIVFNHIPTITTTKQSNPKVCDICHFSKQERLPFPQSYKIH